MNLVTPSVTSTRPRGQSGYSKLTSTLGAVALSASLLMTQSLADELQPSLLPGAIDDSQIDEVIVKGARQKRQIRREIRTIENQIYTMFNDLNTDDDYDIICRKFARIGSQIVRTKCKAKVYWDALSNLAEEDGLGQLSPRVLANQEKHIEAFRQKLVEVAKGDPALRQALLRRKKLIDKYKADSVKSD